MTVGIDAFDTAGPGDTEGLSAVLAAHDPTRVRRLALLVKTEGSARIDDFAGELATLRAREAVLAHGGDALLERSLFLHSTGTEGAMTPFGYLLTDSDPDPGLDPDPDGDTTPGTGPAPQRAALTLGIGQSRTLRGSEIGTPTHVRAVERAVGDAAADAGLDPDQIALAIVKTPLAGHDGPPAATGATSAAARAAGALGAALALGEIHPDAVVPSALGRDLGLYSRRTMVFGGSASSEAARAEVLVLGNSPRAHGPLRIASGPLADLLDAPGIRRVLGEAGAAVGADGTVRAPELVAALLVKAGHRSDGTLRGSRTTVLTSQLGPDQQVRAVLSGVAGSVLGTGRMFVSAGSVHQAPDGGGLCAAIVARHPGGEA